MTQSLDMGNLNDCEIYAPGELIIYLFGIVSMLSFVLQLPENIQQTEVHGAC